MTASKAASKPRSSRYRMPPARADRAPLAGRVAVVTGASSGVGFALCEALAGLGATVYALGRDPKRLQRLRDRCGKKLQTVSVDLTDGAQIAAFARQLNGKHRKVHVLIHAAGVLDRRRIDAGAVEQLEWHLAVNVQAPMALTTLLLPQLRRGQGDVVFLLSSAGQRPSPGLAAYAMSKAALTTFAEALRAEENTNGLRVLSVLLGRTATPMQHRLVKLEGGQYRGRDLIAPEDVAQAIVATLQLGQRSEVIELAIRPKRPPPRQTAR